MSRCVSLFAAFSELGLTAGYRDLQQVHFIHKLWGPRPLITTGGYDRDSGLKVAEETGQLVGYGSKFLANVRPVFFLSSRTSGGLTCVCPRVARPSVPHSREPAAQCARLRHVLRAPVGERLYGLSVLGGVPEVSGLGLKGPGCLFTYTHVEPGGRSRMERG